MVSYLIIGADSKEYGPSTADEIRQWVAEGRANGQTLVKAEGENDWKPMASFPEFAGLKFRTPPPPHSAPPPVLTAPAIGGTALPVDQPLPVGACLKAGWNLLRKNFGVLFFATLMVVAVRSALSAVQVVNVFALLFKGVFYGGLYMVFLKCLRNQPTRPAEAFSGFGENFVQLLLVGVVRLLLTTIGFLCCILPGIFLFVAWIFAVPLVADKRLIFWDAMELSRRVVARHWFQVALLLFLSFLPIILLTVYTDIVLMDFLSSAVHAGQLDLQLWTRNPAEFSAQVQQVSRAFADKHSYLGIIQLLIIFLVQPFAKGVTTCAYEILFNSRPAPPP
jgi:hypothetical protein